MAAPKIPTGLAVGGRELWMAITTDHDDLDVPQKVQLLEACRAKDRLDRLDELLRGDIDLWVRLTHRTMRNDYELKIDAALVQANATANLMKQLLAALRLPDEKGKRPAQRGARGAYSPQVAGGKVAGKVSSLDRARAARSS